MSKQSAHKLTDIFSESEIAYVRPYVDEMFKEADDRHKRLRLNPITSGGWVSGVDPIRPQKEAAVRAVLARRWFLGHGPRDLQPLPLGYDEREEFKGAGGAFHILSWYARSLEARKYDVKEHPAFFTYACGVMASEFAPHFTKVKKDLQLRFPPRQLDGLGPGLYWQPAALHAETMRRHRRFMTPTFKIFEL